MAKKISIKKLAAGVLALLMVVTALPVSGVTAVTSKAADDDTVEVYRSYNPNSGEHLLTISKEEQDAVVAAGRSDEGVRWIAPVSSNTPVYRSYNPNTGEHLLVPRAEAEWLETQGWDNEGIKMYSDDEKGVAVYRVYNPNATNAGTHLYTDKEEAEYLVSIGWKWDNDGKPILYGVGNEDKSGVIELVDDSGFQEDGTALPKDKLSITYGSSLGVPKNIVWYCNGAAKAVYTIDGSDVTKGFNNNDLLNNVYSTTKAMPTGEWYVTIENTAGDIFTTQSIIIAEEGVAVITDFSIEDDYETPKVTIDTKTDTIIVNVSLNKEYEGDFYITKSNTKDFTSAPDWYACLGSTTHGTNESHTAATFDSVTKAKDFTNKAATASSNDGVKFVDSEGVAHYKIVVSKLQKTTNNPSLERGTEYIVIFDQENISSDDVGIASSKKENLNISEAFTCPYVTAPDKIVVTDKQNATDTKGWTATLYLGEDVAKYIDIAAAKKAVIGGADLYEGTSTDVTKGTKFSTTTTDIAKGVADSGTAGNCQGAKANNEEYVYATFGIVKGIFGADKFELVSDVAGIPAAIATGVSLSESTADPKDIEVKIENLKNASNVFLVTAEFDTDAATTLAAALKGFADNGTYVAVMPAKKGAASVTFDDVLTTVSHKKIETNTATGDFYAVVVVPENTDDYRTYGIAADGSDLASLNVRQIETTYVLDRTTGVTASKAATIKVNDQFGEAIETVKKIDKKNMSGGATNGTAAVHAFEMDTAGVVTLTAAGATAKKDLIGDVWYINLNGTQTFYAEVTGLDSSDEKAEEWTMYIK